MIATRVEDTNLRQPSHGYSPWPVLGIQVRRRGPAFRLQLAGSSRPLKGEFADGTTWRFATPSGLGETPANLCALVANVCLSSEKEFGLRDPVVHNNRSEPLADTLGAGVLTSSVHTKRAVFAPT